jgi:hypothetical protein
MVFFGNNDRKEDVSKCPLIAIKTHRATSGIHEPFIEELPLVKQPLRLTIRTFQPLRLYQKSRVRLSEHIPAPPQDACL